MTNPRFTVIKIGGSVLRDEASYGSLARRMAEQLAEAPTWFVVSAAYGITDELERLACATDACDPRRLLERQSRASGVPPGPPLEVELRRGVREVRAGRMDRLLAWGEQASADAFRSHLAKRGFDVPIVELSSETTAAESPVALVPGFYLRDTNGGVRCLPRGGSDISAVLAAIRLGAPSVRFWKHGGGIRIGDRVLQEIEASTLLQQLSSTIRPLHPDAIVLASRWGIDLVLEDPFGHAPPTRVVPRPRTTLGLTSTKSREPSLPPFDGSFSSPAGDVR